MRFLGAIWKLLVGIKDALVLIFMLLFFGFLYIGLSARPNPVGEGVLVVDLDGAVVEQPSAPDTAELITGSSRLQEYRLRDLVAALDAAKDDKRIKAVALDLDGFVGGGQTALGDLGAALDRVRKAGKPVVAYAAGYADDGYQLAAHASEVWMHPLGAVAIAGPGGQQLYYKGLLDKLGVTANVYRVGTYKAAVEPFTRSDMSPEARENLQSLAGALLETWRTDVIKARPAAAVDSYMRDPVAAVGSAGDLGKAALAARLVDKLGERRAFEDRLGELGGKDAGQHGGYRSVELDDYLADAVDIDPAGPIGVVTVAGEIVDGKGPLGTAAGDSIAEAIEKGLRARDLKALVVRVDSPGGSVLASERIRQALLAARARKIPVVVSMGNVAASGGYWVSTAGDFVYAEPSTITGSIGVFGILPSFEGTMTKLGLGADGVKTTPLSGEPDLFHGPSPAADALIQAGVEGVYRNFLAIVAKSRNKSPADIDRIAQGRVWDGGTARQLGLVDGFGGMDEAIAKAAELAKLGDERGVRYLERPRSFTEQLLGMLAGEDELEAEPADALATLAPAPEWRLRTALAELRSILSGPSIQVRCLECGPAVATIPVRAEAGLTEALLGWLTR
ncbi:MAG TPA: signal peptide peptidase SppA [Sphingomicrobium sp.]|jgi:protease-4|nr:signal peptide peptidase SppA [Sphingomicrobium sp.]